MLGKFSYLVRKACKVSCIGLLSMFLFTGGLKGVLLFLGINNNKESSVKIVRYCEV